MRETLLDDLGVEAEVSLFQGEDDDIFDMFLGKKWGMSVNADQKVKFAMTIANTIYKHDVDKNGIVYLM